MAESDLDAHPYNPGGGGDRGGFVRDQIRSLPSTVRLLKRPVSRGRMRGGTGEDPGLSSSRN